VDILPLGNVMGAEVLGLDLSHDVSEDVVADLSEGLSKYLVLCLRDQKLAPETFVRVARRFGRPKASLLRQDRLSETPEVSIVSNRQASMGGKPMVHAKAWHTDDSYFAKPAMFTMLQAITLPKRGGNTDFINTCAVLEAMPSNLRQRIEGLRAIHTYQSRRNLSAVARRSDQEIAETPAVDHPLVRTLPGSGRQALYINPNRIERILGWNEPESDALLDELYDFAFRSEFQYSHEWRDGDLVIWDNRCTMHKANADYDIAQLRVMHRVMLEGEVPV
jgi:taurine dioxygenase